MKSHRLRAFDRKMIKGFVGLIGVDEAGRGALAGPVVAAAVAARSAFYDTNWCMRNASQVNDSKLLTPEQREKLYERIRWLEREARIVVGVGRAEVDEIEDHNVYGATQVAMRRAIEEILEKAGIAPHEPDPLFVSQMPAEETRRETLKSWRILVDGKPLKALGYPHHALVQGDSRALCVAMASIVAKVTRDRHMVDLHGEYPHYHFASCKGYGTTAHRKALLEVGPCPLHRKVFLQKILEAQWEDGQEEFGFEMEEEMDRLVEEGAEARTGL